jgi:hypothetical protein
MARREGGEELRRRKGGREEGGRGGVTVERMKGREREGIERCVCLYSCVASFTSLSTPSLISNYHLSPSFLYFLTFIGHFTCLLLLTSTTFLRLSTLSFTPHTTHAHDTHTYTHTTHAHIHTHILSNTHIHTHPL